ncbi:peptidoglycan-binding domain-containing protein [Candidatus Clostridium stratigraminis]|uniref:Peptidoglycan-binding protein n=1 Tax=Candidatus Clostridium stratigraminis TaxID=3381661 RepID=A0ABW8T8S2_9CLOT
MNKRLKSVSCALAATMTLVVLQNTVRFGSLGVDVVSAASETTSTTTTPPKTSSTSSSSTTYYASGYRMLKMGSTGSDVKNLQAILNNNGAKLAVDGIFGKLTKAAVMNYQKAKGLAVDGIVGPKTYAVLIPTSVIPTSIVKLGSRSNDVKYLQTNLNKLGYKLAVDGIFGKLTLAAVKDFQKKNALVVDGIAGPKTFGKLYEKTNTTTTPTKPTTPTTPTTPDVVTTASVVNKEDAFKKAISKDGTWIIATLKDLTFTEPLVLDGQFKNGKKDADGKDILQRKIGLYTQDNSHNVTARFSLTAPKITIMSANASIEHGTFNGDIYVAVPDFQLKDMKVNGNVYFSTKAAKDTFKMDAASSITGKQELKLLPEADVVTSASLVDNTTDFEKAISKDGKWIIATINNIKSDNELVLDGDFKNGKKNPDGSDAIQRKIALYTQAKDSAGSNVVTARFTLTAPKLTINSANARIQSGMFKGDVYVNVPNFQLVDAIVDGNMYFATQAIKDSFKADATSIITGKQEVPGSPVSQTSIKIGKVDYNAHGSGVVVAAVAMAGDKIAAVSVDEYQFMPLASITAPLPNTAKLGANYKDPATTVLASKLTNTAYYSANMKTSGGATLTWDQNMAGVQAFAKGKTIAELDAAIKANKNADGTDKDPKVDAVTSATFTSTNGYLSAILEAAKNASAASVSSTVDTSQLSNLKIGRVDYNAHGSGVVNAAAATLNNKIVATIVDEYQFMPLASITAALPNTAKLGANYKDPATTVLASKLTNTAYYSANMKTSGGATQTWDKNMAGVQEFATGKTITELDSAIKANKNADGTDKDPKVDAVTSATFTSTNGYLSAILEAAKVAK